MTVSDEILVDVKGVKVHFPIRKGVIFDKTVGHVYAVDGVDLQIRKGETYGLVGESGCGKSTLGRAILNLEPPTAGSVEFDGVDIASLKGEELRHKRQDIQMVFQDPMGSLDPRQTVESLLLEGMKAHGLAKDAKQAASRLRDLLKAVGLPVAALKKYPHEFSGGQRQRIGIARALSVEPQADRRRRAGLRPRRVGPGAGHQPARGAAGRVRPDLPRGRPRPRRRAPHQRPDRRHVPRRPRRGVGRRGPLRQAAAPLHARR